LPNMQYSPSIAPNVCQGNALTVTDTVRSYFDNYTHYQWQLSTDGGTNWTDVDIPGDATPYFNSSLNVWEYTTAYTTPILGAADSGHLYRVIVATSSTNLSDNNCRTTDQTNIITLSVLDCGEALETKLIAFNGKVNNNKATLSWTTSSDNDEQVYFELEKSFNGTNFTTIGTLAGNNSSGPNYYSYTDPDNIDKKVFYRIKMLGPDGRGTYSRILQLNGTTQAFSFVSVINPFNQSLFFDLSSVKAGKGMAELIDQFGNPVRKKSLDIREGVTQFTFDNTSSLAAGIYILKVQMGEIILYRKVLKQNY
jgi:hypothetical protein